MVRTIRLVLLSSLLSLIALCWQGASNRAHAVTIVSSHSSPIDFGNVVVGTTSDIIFTTQFSYGSGETFNSSSVLVDNNFGNFIVDILSAADDCNDPGFVCNWKLTFAPIVSGFQTSGPYEFLAITTHQGTSASVSILLQGTGVAAVPVPAALPLFASGLGVMGWLARRTKRKNASALAAA